MEGLLGAEPKRLSGGVTTALLKTYLLISIFFDIKSSPIELPV
jgi:hypothetical protein